MSGDICPTCDQVHTGCASHVKFYRREEGGGRLPKPRPCRRPAGDNAKCHSHGGGARHHKGPAAERKAEKLLRRFGSPIDTTPSEALLDAVKWTAGYVAWLRDKVAEIPSDEAVVFGLTREKEGGDDRGTTYEAKPNAWVELLGTWHDRLVRICAEAIKAGVEERRVRMAESQGALVADVIRRILADLNLSREQQEMVGVVVPNHLRLVANQ